MAAGAAILDYFDNHRLLEHATEMGDYLSQRLQGLQHHAMVGDIRGTGLMWGLEFVRDRDSRQPFDPALLVHQQVYQAARERGLILLSSGGCDRGSSGDMALIAPPIIITRQQTDELVDIIDETLTQVEQMLPCNTAPCQFH